MEDATFEFILQHSLLHYWNTILDSVLDGGLDGLKRPETQEALAEVEGILPPMSELEVLVFSYYYVYQPIPAVPVSVLMLEKDLRLPGLYLVHQAAWAKLLSLDLLKQMRPEEFIMPPTVRDAISIVDMSCYMQIGHGAEYENRKEIFYRLAFDPKGKQGKLPDDW